MIGRVSTNGTIRTYHGHLGRSTWNQQQAMNTVLTRRRFNQFSDDPALATQSFRAHSAFSKVVTQRNSNESIVKKMEAGSSSIHELSSLYQSALSAAETGRNDPDAGGWNALGQTLLGVADNMVKTLNAKYGDKFVFAGANAQTAPFEITKNADGTLGKLLYRGMEVDDIANLKDMQMMTTETTYVDVGLGFQLDAQGSVIPSTAFNSAISGVGLLGSGMEAAATDARGNATEYSDVPTNVISVIVEMGNLLRGHDPATDHDAILNRQSVYQVADIDYGTMPPNAAGTAQTMNLSVTVTDDAGNKSTHTITINPNIQVPDANATDAKKLEAQKANFTAITTALNNATTATPPFPTGAGGAATNFSDYFDVTMVDGGKDIKITSKSEGDAAATVNSFAFAAGAGGAAAPKLGPARTVAPVITKAKRLDDLFDNLQNSWSGVITNWTEVETRAQFLKSNDSRLEDTQYTLQEQYEGLDLVNPAEAISAFSYAQYAYNAALRIGNQVLSQSFIDYMN